MKVAYALDYAKATALAVKTDFTLLAILEKMFPFIFLNLDLTHTYDLFRECSLVPVETVTSP